MASTPSTPPIGVPEKTTQLISKSSSINHRQRAGRHQPTSLIHLGAICLTSLVIGLNDIPSLAIFGTPASSNNVSSILQTTYTALPFLLGSILAAAFLDPLVRASPRFRCHPFLLLAFASLLISSARALLLLIPHPSCDGDVQPVVLVMGYLLTGIGSTIALVLTAFLCGRQTKGPMLGIMHGIVPLGVVLGAAMAGVETDIGDGFITNTPTGERQGLYHLATLALTLLSTALLHTASQSSDAHTLPTAPTPDDAEAQPDNITLPLLPETPDKINNFPPPPSTHTLLTALLALFHLATIAALPFWLVNIPINATTHHHQHSVAYTTAALWTGLTLGRFIAILPLPNRQLERYIPRTLIVTPGFLVLLWLMPPGMATAGKVTLLCGLVVGFVLGPVYTSAVGMLMRAVGEGGRLGAVGIVVAFGHAGAVGGLVMVRLAGCLEGTVVLHLVVGAGFGGMVLCWKGLVDKGDVKGVSAWRVEV